MQVQRSLSDFTDGFNLDQLFDEIAEGGISQPCVNITNRQDKVWLNFQNAVTVDDETKIDEIISDHVVVNGDIYSENNDQVSTTAEDWQTQNLLHTGYLPGGLHNVHWFYNYTTESGVPNIRLMVNDKEVHNNTMVVPVANSTIIYNYCEWELVELPKGDSVIRIQVRSGGKTTTTIHKSKIYIVEI